MRQIVWGLLAIGLISTTARAEEPTPAPGLRLQIQSAVAAVAVMPAGSAVALQTPPATPAAAPAPAPPPKKVTVTTGADVPLLTGYVFRGIVQEFNPKVTVQPFLDIAVAANSTTTVNFGSWNSFHTGSNKDNGSRGLKAWY